MFRFALRHFTAIIVILAIAAWGIFYLPDSPTWAVFQLKRAVDDRNGAEAARHIDFQAVVRSAGYEMVQKQGGADPLSTMVGNAAVDLLLRPMARLAESWAVQKVNDGANDVQMPLAAVAASVVLLHRSGDTAYTDFKDPKGREWEIHLARGDEGSWRVVEVNGVGQLLEQLKRDHAPAVTTP